LNTAVDTNGMLLPPYTRALQTWISSQSNLLPTVMASLMAGTGDNAATALNPDAVTALLGWLLRPDGDLPVELAAATLLWLHRRVALDHISLALPAPVIATLRAGVSGDILDSLDAVSQGVINTALSGQAIAGVSSDAVARLIGILTGYVPEVDIPQQSQMILGTWVSGVYCDCNRTLDF
jgi:hypothetical protein